MEAKSPGYVTTVDKNTQAQVQDDIHVQYTGKQH
jgi:hypothetical protein